MQYDLKMEKDQHR